MKSKIIIASLLAISMISLTNKAYFSGLDESSLAQRIDSLQTQVNELKAASAACCPAYAKGAQTASNKDSNLMLDILGSVLGGSQTSDKTGAGTNTNSSDNTQVLADYAKKALWQVLNGSGQAGTNRLAPEAA